MRSYLKKRLWSYGYGVNPRNEQCFFQRSLLLPFTVQLRDRLSGVSVKKSNEIVDWIVRSPTKEVQTIYIRLFVRSDVYPFVRCKPMKSKGDLRGRIEEDHLRVISQLDLRKSQHLVSVLNTKEKWTLCFQRVISIYSSKFVQILISAESLQLFGIWYLKSSTNCWT